MDLTVIGNEIVNYYTDNQDPSDGIDIVHCNIQLKFTMNFINVIL